jgi:hypothetical protein
VENRATYWEEIAFLQLWKVSSLKYWQYTSIYPFAIYKAFAVTKSESFVRRRRKIMTIKDTIAFLSKSMLDYIYERKIK